MRKLSFNEMNTLMAVTSTLVNESPIEKEVNSKIYGTQLKTPMGTP